MKKTAHHLITEVPHISPEVDLCELILHSSRGMRRPTWLRAILIRPLKAQPYGAIFNAASAPPPCSPQP